MNHFPTIPLKICVAPANTLPPGSNARVDIYNSSVDSSVILEFGNLGFQEVQKEILDPPDPRQM